MRTLFLLALVGLFVGCASQKNWTATGGSRADGIVRLSYEYGRFEKPVLDNAQGQSIASQRCAIWGYESATAFGGAMTQCAEYNPYGGCVRTVVTKEYQCVGNPSDKNRYERAEEGIQGRNL